MTAAGRFNALAAVLVALAGAGLAGCVLQLDLRKVDTGSERTLELGNRSGEKEGPPAHAGGPSGKPGGSDARITP